MVPSFYFPQCPPSQNPNGLVRLPQGKSHGAEHLVSASSRGPPIPGDQLDLSALDDGPVIKGQGARAGFRLARHKVNIRQSGAGPEVEAEGGG